jgi:hypothetical protein
MLDDPILGIGYIRGGSTLCAVNCETTATNANRSITLI